MSEPTLCENTWQQQTLEQSILRSLQRRVTVEELIHPEGALLRDSLREGDELWSFRTPPETWTQFFPRCGMEGYALVRDRRVIAEIFTAMN